MTSESALDSAASRSLLGRRLRRARESVGLSLREASRRTSVPLSQLSRLENGKAPVAPDDLVPFFKEYAVTDAEQISALTELARSTKRSTNWRDSYASVISPNFAQFIELEASASALTWYENAYVPGLLQTRGYVRGLMDLEPTVGIETPAAELTKRIEVRLNRQRILDRETGAPTLSVVLTEAVIRVRVGSAAVMAEQLKHLVEMAARPGIEIQIMPDDRHNAGLLIMPFCLLDFPSTWPLTEPSRVYIDQRAGFFWLDSPTEIDTYRKARANLRETALDQQQSVDYIEQKLAELQNLA
ncbi:transcriptional regulator with XRE-family HTH domain [Kribbella aluminosa]|uniref:Transcriptional regulator with XRE-family HTH domain n=1 Tax=Kribbella aluminosa TaxID=416017 RepID=A0ABS4UTK7_9ACTN|nr:helix-turn-helix transcriptional regulator [Kribbella aluminosa]MBP2354960.1 transcriptional regulator with XRE-family HTH domain [Kribbella aluminosa]